jgi:hypothetical protein
MKMNNCLAYCKCNNSGRRDFIKKASLVTAGSLFLGQMNLFARGNKMRIPVPRSYGLTSGYVPLIKVTFVRRQEDYGMLWPGAVYDGEAARKKYTEGISKAADMLSIKLDIKSTPVYSLEEANSWLEEAKTANVDGLVLLILDRQKHTWPTAQLAAKSGIPTVIYSPLGTSFTTNTSPLTDIPGCVVFSTNDFNQCIYGLKMLKAGALMKRTRCVVIQGNERKKLQLADTGITLQYVPSTTFFDIYNSMPVNDEIIRMAEEYVQLATELRHATREDVINGIKSYLVAGKILETERADAISMDCLGALSDKPISLPCISWSKMNDNGIPAACEADTGAIAAQIIVQYLFDRPGFQQDPVADTSDDTIIGAHCSCPTRLNGFNNLPEPFEIVHHHGNRDAVPRTIWRKGQRVTCMDFLPAGEVNQNQSQMLISTGVVEDNMNVPPSGGCVVSVKVKFDGGHEVLSFPGFHHLFFYGEYKRELKAFCKLFNFEARIV